MEENRIRYPIGIQTFRNVIEGEYLYVDKTGYVHQLADRYKYVFLSRPRRFGKSLLSSTIHSYFAGENLIFSLLGYYTEAEVKSAVGRADASKELVKVGANISTATSTIDGWIVG